MELVKSFKQSKLIKYAFFALLGSIVLAVSSKIKIPFYPVPMTMQTFVVILLGITLGHKLALATVGLYLIEGIIGLPVFSNSPEKGIGFVYFIGPTMGYLIGFLFTTFLSGYLNLKTNFLMVFIKLTFAVSFIYLFGLIWLGTLIGWDKPIFELGALPFLYAELFKVLLISLLAKKILKLRKFI